MDCWCMSRSGHTVNPADLVCCGPEVVQDFHDRLLPVSDATARKLKKRCLTNLHAAKPA